MEAVGIIAEYNPFHRGHAYQIEQARQKSGAEAVIVAMSGPVTQRGQFARHDKFVRARMALLQGADLVLELPVRFACAAAPDFARGGVSLLASLGVVGALSFGCERQALPFLSAWRAQDTAGYEHALRRALGAGQSYAAAASQALGEALSPEAARALAAPNAILALEYLRALPDGMAAIPVARVGEGYDSLTLSPLASAAGIRGALERGDLSAALAAVPHPELLMAEEAAGRVHEPEALTQALLYRLRTSSPEALCEILDMGEGLERRFLAAARRETTRDGLLLAVKTRRYAYTRLSRAATHTLLGLTRRFACAHPTPEYARILGFRRSAGPLLHEIRRRSAIPLIAKAADYDSPLFALDTLTEDLWALGLRDPASRASGRDFRRSLVVL